MLGMDFAETGLVPATVVESMDGDSLAGLVSLDFLVLQLHGTHKSLFLDMICFDVLCLLRCLGVGLFSRKLNDLFTS